MDARPTGDFLVVDDEPGIREGLAAFMRLRGHRVQTAANVADALSILDRATFDAVVTDWRLGQDVALPVVESTRRQDGGVDRPQCLVISGHPGEVLDVFAAEGIETGGGSGAAVLEKPVMPNDLLQMLESALRVDPASGVDGSDLQAPQSSPEAGDGGTAEDAIFARLPVDTASRADLMRRICGGVEIEDGGRDAGFVWLRAPLAHDDLLDELAACGGDLRVLHPGGGPELPVVEIRLFRDSRPDGVDVVLRSTDTWPSDPTVAFAIDFDGDTSCTPSAFAQLVSDVGSARDAGRSVDLLNVPDGLRISLETLGEGVRLPMRREPGPRLPDVVARLWS